MNNITALLMDIGNSIVKWGVLEGGLIQSISSVTHEKINNVGFSSITTSIPRKVDRVIASNVAGTNFAVRLSAAIGIHCQSDINFVTSAKSAFGIINAYKNPRQFGVDRWVALVGARSEFRSSLCVVDIGTAVTIDVINKDGKHIGGQIIPGIELMEHALSDETSNIKTAKKMLKDPLKGTSMFANNTKMAIQNGSVNAISGAIERVIGTLRSDGYKPKVIVTGGDAPRILKQFDDQLIYRPHLILQGLAYIVQNEGNQV